MKPDYHEFQMVGNQVQAKFQSPGLGSQWDPYKDHATFSEAAGWNECILTGVGGGEGVPDVQEQLHQWPRGVKTQKGPE